MKVGAGAGVVLLAALSVGVLSTVPPAVAALTAQELGDRVRVSDGEVVFRVAVREGVEVCEDGVVHRGRRIRWQDAGRQEDRTCSTDRAEVLVTVAGGSVRELVLGPWPSARPESGARDLGRVAAEGAARFLLDLARSARDAGEAAKGGLFAATVLDSVQVWPELLGVARDRSLDGEVRETAVFWVGQAASDAVTAGLADLAGREEEEQGVRNAAVFALSRRPDADAVPALMELARTAGEAETRRSAMFWLARSNDERVLPFFERILLERPAGG